VPLADAVALNQVRSLTTENVQVSPAFMRSAALRASSALGRPSAIRVGSLARSPRSSPERIGLLRSDDPVGREGLSSPYLLNG
jgi:hypothetical protein